MDAAVNPFAPGAGTQPPELSGREPILATAVLALQRARLGRAARNVILLGLRGVGKTVLLNRLEEAASTEGFLCVTLEAREDKPLAEMLVPPLRSILFRLSRSEGALVSARRGLAVLRAFAGAFKVSVGDVEFGVDAEAGSADSGALEADLPEVFVTVAQAAKAGGRGVAILIDELQYLKQADLAALIVAMHKVSQKGLPVVFFGAGLPQLAALAADAKSYSERLFEYITVSSLDEDAARNAIRAPVQREGVAITEAAISEIIRATAGYPYFLQEWGSQAWNIAARSPITAANARDAGVLALARLDESFFRTRFDRLTPREREFLRAMAELGPGPHRSGEVAGAVGATVNALAPLRASLIRKGMIYSPQHGDTAFTVPMFDQFMRRTLPLAARRS